MDVSVTPESAELLAHVVFNPVEAPSESPYHCFHHGEEIRLFRSRLLSWYDGTKRELPWRTLAATEDDVDVRTYGGESERSIFCVLTSRNCYILFYMALCVSPRYKSLCSSPEKREGRDTSNT
ncbi:adenine DNA glycosylase isoform X1 [Tachysurus ichikawai]